jgi:MoxR-like ATPase
MTDHSVAAQATLQRLRETLGRVIRGKPAAIEHLLIGVLAEGHVLIEDVPGVGKTTLAKALSKALSVGFARVQFTPDLLPADILGSQVLNPKEGTLSFHTGPIFTNILLVDEINRASPRTQSALLEAMNEEQVTIDGETRALPRPFFVIATQNPVDFQGTYPLPEAQLDRFLLKLSIGYPSEDEELGILMDRKQNDPLYDVEPVASGAELLEMQRAVRAVEVKESVSRYLLRVVAATREDKKLLLGISPRGSLALFRAAQARSFLEGRRYVTPDDIQALAPAVLGHRIQPTREARYGGQRAEALIAAILDGIAVPT